MERLTTKSHHKIVRWICSFLFIILVFSHFSLGLEKEKIDRRSNNGIRRIAVERNLKEHDQPQEAQEDPAEDEEWLRLLPKDENLGSCAQELSLSLANIYRDQLAIYQEQQTQVSDNNNDNDNNRASFCIDGISNPRGCRCESALFSSKKPLQLPRGMSPTRWNTTHQRNVDLASKASNMSIAFVGDSITEHFCGTDLASPYGQWQKVKDQFQRFFPDGVALGIGGDRTPQLLYRLKHGEMPETLTPPVWWVLIGTNDLADQCSVETILMGILRNVAEIRSVRPDATVVINSILPRPNKQAEWKPNAAYRDVLWATLYHDITWINERLACIALAMDSVEYFDATSFFLRKDDPEKVDMDLLYDRLHPSDKGMEVWGGGIREKLQTLTTNTNDETNETPSQIANDSLPHEKWLEFLPDVDCADGLSIAGLFETHYENYCNMTATEDSGCGCHSPLEPAVPSKLSPQLMRRWDLAHQHNIDRAKNDTKDANVAFVGDSITEHFLGKDLAHVYAKYKSVREEFNRLFPHSVVLGIGGDQTQNVLYRLQNGEVPDGLDPPIWWLLIGTNDLSDWCTPESVLMGILRDVAEIHSMRPNATVVVNSILPRPNEAAEWKPTAIYPDALWATLYHDITWINEHLACAIPAMDGVEYFDATSFFLRKDDPEKIDLALMPDRLHPSGKGMKIWGDAMLQRIQEILSAKEQQPQDDESPPVTIEETNEKTAPPVEPVASSEEWLPFVPTNEDLGDCGSELILSFGILYEQVSGGNLCESSNEAQEDASCNCSSPLQPSPRDDVLAWNKTWHQNMNLAENVENPSVVFVGEDLTQHWLGTGMGENKHNSQLDPMHLDFLRSFPDGVPLGIEGDRISQVLYRLQNGEAPESLTPPIWWVLIGSNDLGDLCSTDTIVLGVWRIVSELQRLQPNATIVVSGLMPTLVQGTRWDHHNLLFMSVVSINQRLECAANGQKNVEYFDAAPVFLERDNIHLRSEYYLQDGKNPSSLGSHALLLAIAERVELLTSALSAEEGQR